MERAALFDYQTWSEFRYQIRVYVHLAEQAARACGVEPQQHQLMLAIRGYVGDEPPTIGDIAERLQLRHHSAVELVDRAEALGLVERRSSGHGRTVRVVLTPLGRRRLDAVSRRVQPHLEASAAQLIETLTQLSAHFRSRARRAAAATPVPSRPRAAARPTAAGPGRPSRNGAAASPRRSRATLARRPSPHR